MGDELLQSDPSSSSDFRFDGCPVTSEEGHKRDLKSVRTSFLGHANCQKARWICKTPCVQKKRLTRISTLTSTHIIRYNTNWA